MKQCKLTHKPKKFETQLSNWYPKPVYLESVIENFCRYNEEKHGIVAVRRKDGFQEYAVFTDAKKLTDKDYGNL